jgi:hypothetical protein
VLWLSWPLPSAAAGRRARVSNLREDIDDGGNLVFADGPELAVHFVEEHRLFSPLSVERLSQWREPGIGRPHTTFRVMKHTF